MKVHWNDSAKHFYVMDGERIIAKLNSYKALENYLRNKRVTKYSMTTNALKAARRQGMKG